MDFRIKEGRFGLDIKKEISCYEQRGSGTVAQRGGGAPSLQPRSGDGL